MKDFLDEDCNLLVFDVFKRIHNLKDICIMQYNSITTSILKCLKLLSIDRTSVKRIPNPCMPVFLQPVLISEKCTKIIYNYLNEKEVVPTAINKWRTELTPYGVDDISVIDVFKICFKTTNDSSVQGYSLEFYTEFFQLDITLKKLILSLLTAVGFVRKM